MSHHDTDNHDYNEAEAEANSTVDMFAMLGVVLVVVIMAVYYVSR